MPMNKTQWQRLALGIIGGAIVFFAVIQFLVVPAIQERNEHREAIASANDDIARMDRLLNRGTEVRRTLMATRAAVRALALEVPLPVLGNYLLDMTRRIKDAAAGLPVEVTSVADYDLLNTSAWNPAFQVYRVRVVGRAGLPDLARWLRALHEQSAFVSLTGLNIVPQPETPEQHHVSFVVGWLVWTDPEQRPEYLKEPPAEAGAGAAPAAARPPARSAAGS